MDKRLTFRTFRLAIDESAHDVIGLEVTTADRPNCRTWIPEELKQYEPKPERKRTLSEAMTEDFFRARLEPMIELKHPLAVRANRLLARVQIEAALSPGFARKRGDGKLIEDGEPFGTTVRIAVGGSARPGARVCRFV